MFRRVLIAAWAVFGGFVLLAIFSPKLIARVPHIGFIRLYLIVLALTSAVYGIARLYRQGMKRAKGS